ncbi:potassium channel toxin alpha-KTx-like [Mytilus trossulus]|uniref:potassium channel toxin alpha-KTx-like n=1 Tax=Mytilus trossulus TaxID=6551 RepID=UPI00300616BD
MKSTFAIVLLFVCLVGIVSVNGQELYMTDDQCKLVVKGCMSNNYKKAVQADKNCNDCCRRSGCARGDCKGRHCKCKGC